MSLNDPRVRALGLVGLLLLGGCRQGMYNQGKKKALAESDFYKDGLSARVPPADTVARGQLREDRALYTGMGPDGKFLATLPAAVPFGKPLLLRGRQRFDVFCSPCHGRQGNGEGMIVQRGFKQPTSYHIDRLRQMPIGYFYDVMTQGFGQMSSYAAQVSPEDRWAIAAYIRVLQLSQHAPVSELTEKDRADLERATSPEKPPVHEAHP